MNEAKFDSKIDSADVLRRLPSVDAVVQRLSDADAPHDELTAQTRAIIETLRDEIFTLPDLWRTATRETFLIEAAQRLALWLTHRDARSLRGVVNATGVIIHTNLGRAPLASSAIDLINQAAGYCNLEYDLTSGERGTRGARAEDLLCVLTGAEAALVVNNCAAATVLILAALAADGETVISRGELVAIGGDFRIPDVMKMSGTQMREVGTTNRTTLEDYQQAVTSQTRLIACVHPSNYRVVGFTDSPTIAELAALANQHGLTLYEDAGSGALIDLSNFGLSDEPVIARSIKSGAHIVSFSADKLLGASQAGCIVGRASLIQKLRRHPLARAVRADKLSFAALEATLELYRRATHFQQVPTLKMIATPKHEITGRVQRFIEHLQPQTSNLRLHTRDGDSAIGGGSAPLTRLPTTLLAVTSPHHTLDELARALRRHTPPVIARIENDALLFDFRTVSDEQETMLAHALIKIDYRQFG